MLLAGRRLACLEVHRHLHTRVPRCDSCMCFDFSLIAPVFLLPCRLIELCEARLVAELLQLPQSAAAAEAPHLLCLADELGLVQLRRASVAFIAQHYTEVQVSAPATEGATHHLPSP